MQSSVVYFKQNKTCFVLFFRGDWTAQPSLFVPTHFLSFLGEWGLNLCTIYKSRPGPTLYLPHKVSLKKYHIFFIFTNKKTKKNNHLEIDSDGHATLQSLGKMEGERDDSIDEKRSPE